VAHGAWRCGEAHVREQFVPVQSKEPGLGAVQVEAAIFKVSLAKADPDRGTVDSLAPERDFSDKPL
jgi:hypothetical protein